MVDKKGVVLADAIAGPSNIRLSVNTACESIQNAFDACLQRTKILNRDLKKYSFYAGIGLAGCEFKGAREEFFKKKLPFDFVTLQSDAYIACMGAHGGKNGSIVIAGTGVVALKLSEGVKTQIGGWGFPHGDEGAGAWLGLEAVKRVLHMVDGQQESSPILIEIKKKLGNKKENLTQWACNATATEYAGLTPIIVKQAQKNDIVAVTLLKQAAKHIESILSLLLEKHRGEKTFPCSFLGGMAPILSEYMKKDLRKKLSPPLFDACQGAILMVKNYKQK